MFFLALSSPALANLGAMYRNNTVSPLKLVHMLEDWGEAFGTMVDRPKPITLAFPLKLKALTNVNKIYKKNHNK